MMCCFCFCFLSLSYCFVWLLFIFIYILCKNNEWMGMKWQAKQIATHTVFISLHIIFDDMSLNKPETRSISELRECSFFFFIFIYFWTRKELKLLSFCLPCTYTTQRHIHISSGSHCVYFVYLVHSFFSRFFSLFLLSCVFHTGS